MADTINIGSYEVSCFKVGSSDCKIYLGDILLYPHSTPPTPTVKDYLRLLVKDDGYFTFFSTGVASGNSLSYSLDSGTTWNTLVNSGTTPYLDVGDVVMWKGSNLVVSDDGIGKFSASTRFDVEGNIMSLVYGDDFETATTITNVGQFRSLFDSNTNVINASGMTLPATTISQDAYRSMFFGCSGLASTPALPATTLGNSCYKYMFSNCTSLTTAPELPATSLAQSCYSYMFRGCTSLVNAPVLPATTLLRQCYEYMFSGCTSLTTAPDLDAPTLAYQSNRYMFADCTSLNYIKCLATDISATQCLNYWVNNVASSGTFVKAPNMSSWPRGINGIPTNWTVENICLYNFCGVNANGGDVIINNGTTILSSGNWTSPYPVEGEVGAATTTIGAYCFQTPKATLSALTIGNTVTTIEHEAFMETSKLTTLTIPASVTQIDFWAFTRCNGLQEVIFEGATPPTFTNQHSGVFHDYCPPVVYVPDSAVATYRAIDGTVWTNQTWSTNIIQPISNRP